MRLLLTAAIVIAALAAAVEGHPQQPTRLPLIVLVIPGPAEANAELVGAFRQGLRDLGYVEGKNIRFELWYVSA